MGTSVKETKIRLYTPIRNVYGNNYQFPKFRPAGGVYLLYLLLICRSGSQLISVAMQYTIINSKIFSKPGFSRIVPRQFSDYDGILYCISTEINGETDWYFRFLDSSL